MLSDACCLAAFEHADGSWYTGCWRVNSMHAHRFSPSETTTPPSHHSPFPCYLGDRIAHQSNTFAYFINIRWIFVLFCVVSSWLCCFFFCIGDLIVYCLCMFEKAVEQEWRPGHLMFGGLCRVSASATFSATPHSYLIIFYLSGGNNLENMPGHVCGKARVWEILNNFPSSHAFFYMISPYKIFCLYNISMKVVNVLLSFSWYNWA